MTIKDYDMLKRTNPRIRKYERKENNTDVVISEFSCITEHIRVEEEFLKKIREAGEKAEIIEIKNETIYFRIISDNEFFEELLEKVF